MTREKIEAIFYKGITPSDFAAIYKTRKPSSGNGQTYINVGSVKNNEKAFLDFFSYAEQSIDDNGTLSFKLNGYVLGNKTDNDSKSIIISHRTGKRSDYRILNQQNGSSRHPAFSLENGFPEPKKNSNGEYEDNHDGFLGIIDYLTILIIKTSFHKYYVTFIDEIKNNWPRIDILDNFFNKLKNDRGNNNEKRKLAGILNFNSYDCNFENSKDNPFGNSLVKDTKAGASNIIYYGAPGTGKSYGVEEFIRKNGVPDYEAKLGNNLVHRITLYPEYDYSDFVGQVMPIVNNDLNGAETTITYEFTPGDFTIALNKALLNPDKFVFLVMEEMSRANISSVFGDLFQLLDRDNSGRSEYAINNTLIADYVYRGESNKPIYIPSNLMIIGTVNTCDQNVFAMDTAFKRRFNWCYISTIPKNGFNNNPSIDIALDDSKDITVRWGTLVKSLNDFIVEKMHLREDKQIGPYFIKFNDDKVEKNSPILCDKLLQYLWEDVDMVAGVNSDVRLFSNKLLSFSSLYESFKNGNAVFSEDFLASLQYGDKD